MGSRRGLSRVRFAAPNYGAPWTTPSCSQQLRLRRGKGGRWKWLPSAEPSSARHDLLSDPLAGPRNLDCPKKTRLLMGPNCCFEAGRLFQTQSSRTALSCSCKWMSGHADALAEPKGIDSSKSTRHCRVHGDASRDSFTEWGRCVFSLDKPLSWMSKLAACHKPER
jgi:hypothetical protein